MIKVIETNISLYPNGDMADFQSRVIEVESWDGIVDEIKSAKSVNRHAYIGSLYGVTLPKFCTIENIEYNDRQLQCVVTSYDNRRAVKLLYLIE